MPPGVRCVNDGLVLRLQRGSCALQVSGYIRARASPGAFRFDPFTLIILMRWLLIPLFAFMGALIARSFFLDSLEEMAFRATWAARELIDVSWDNFRNAMRTDTGQKIAAGFVAGGLAGFATAWTVGKLSPSPKR